MNLILFEPDEFGQPLPRCDPRVQHILTVLRRGEDDTSTFDAGLVNGPRGKARLRLVDPNHFALEFTSTVECPPPAPITVIIGLPRPQSARHILRDVTTLGVAAVHFVTTDRGDPNYGESTLWSSGEWRRQLRAGAMQAFSTQLPLVNRGRTLADTLATLAPAGTRCALDNYESAQSLGQTEMSASGVTLAFGAERGWSAGERGLLRAHGFVLAHLGERVLRAETACIAGITLVRAKLGLM